MILNCLCKHHVTNPSTTASADHGCNTTTSLQTPLLSRVWLHTLTTYVQVMVSSLKDSITLLQQGKINGLPDGNVLSLCPNMDLLAISMNRTSIWIFRLNGERVYSVNNKSEILLLAWSASGHSFVVAGADRLLKIYDTNTGELLDQVFTDSELPISLVSWNCADIDFSIDSGDLPPKFRSLFEPKILHSMPKLKFEIKPAVDESHADLDGAGKQIDIITALSGGALLSLTFASRFTVSNFELPKNYTYLSHTSSRDLFDQRLLVENQDGLLELQTLNIDIKDGGRRRYIIEIIEALSSLIALVSHMKDQVGVVTSTVTNFLKFFDRQLQNYAESLGEPSDKDFEDVVVLALGDILMTGVIPASQKDFWTNQLGENGLIRLSAMGNDAFDDSRKLLYGQIILALEKSVILLGRVRGIVKAEQIQFKDLYGLSVETLDQALEVAKDCIPVVYSFTMALHKEQEFFNKFLNWCRDEVVQKLIMDESDPGSFAVAHPHPEFDPADIFEYLDKWMFRPSFLEHLEILAVQVEKLSQHHSSVKLVQHFSDLGAHIEASAKGARDFVRSRLQIGATVELKTKHQKEEVVISEDITYVYQSHLNMISCLHPTPATIHVNGQILEFRILTSWRILLLVEDGNDRHLEVADFELPEQTRPVLSFAGSSSITKPAYIAVSGPTTKTRPVGCVFDANKRNFMVFLP